ncbi:DNA mismatch repair protein MutS [Peptoniphilus equinus]|uniref:DNA mismatch repair protein MutS n=1 Tax=Peptoniphilus equinus TaxID=3016343 RepID=A0ABY7QWE8_9FIRM|nr:DNA mismatch repair protein MutS [Peptoniphilus equinus]WBW50701.1 DNA mismatch repair protein MutS [Peptoniphilus equinus]
MSNENLTPMMQQYMEIKKDYQEEVLFYRLGDFYEMFYDDALLASKVLGLTLTKRSNKQEDIPMCGVPYHVSDTYISKMLDAGYKVAIVDQVEDPKLTKNLVKRAVTKIITPGTFSDTDYLSVDNNFLLSYVDHGATLYLAYGDYTTGEIFTTSQTFLSQKEKSQFFMDELSRITPSEILYSSATMPAKDGIYYTHLNETLQKLLPEVRDVLNSDVVTSISKINSPALFMLINYLATTQKVSLQHLKAVHRYDPEEYMTIDETSKYNLELVASIQTRRKKGSLYAVLDNCETAMGSRTLRKWIEKPLRNKAAIISRQDMIKSALEDLMRFDAIRSALKQTLDIERLSFKIASEQLSPKDCVALATSLDQFTKVKSLLTASPDDVLHHFGEKIPDTTALSHLIQNTLISDPPVNLELPFIRKGYDKDLDELYQASEGGQALLLDLETKERKRTDIKTLKIKYNKILGYFIDVTKSFTDKVPEDYIRKQTLVGSERYFTVELKALERKINGSKERAIERQMEILTALRSTIFNALGTIQNVAEYIGTLDCLFSLAQVARTYHYVRPVISDTPQLTIVEGRHPIVEAMGRDIQFVPNNTSMNAETYFLLITGPNMAGKSTYMRQVALITLMAQMGSYVPATAFHWSLVDRIFTRIGASDNLAGGDSTFMVEMKEVANILDHATNASLILLDEVGRGTSTYDGIAIAWAITEYLVTTTKAKTLFATHYHELTQLSTSLSGLKNLSIAVDHDGDQIIFLRQVIEGASDRSYGIDVAKLAGINDAVIARAKIVLDEHENKGQSVHVDVPVQPTHNPVLPFLKNLSEVDINSLSPLESLNLLQKIVEGAKMNYDKYSG